MKKDCPKCGSNKFWFTEHLNEWHCYHCGYTEKAEEMTSKILEGKMKINLDYNSPRTCALLGAMLSGGDTEKLAKMMVKAQETNKEDGEGSHDRER
jgi:uncharacterized Zn finger protein (UPF0148 family)